ncbi:MAG: formylglycine-generating enzyme family protein [bacterium]|nr:formylglycine-generating enzyme family protein [bacterium]
MDLLSRNIDPPAADADASSGKRLTLLLKACSKGQRAYEWEAREHGVFSWYLRQGLEKEAWRDHCLKAHQLCQYVSEQVKRWALANHVQQMPDFHQMGRADDILLAGGEHAAQAQTEAGPALVSCPICGGMNDLVATFRCLGCGREHLCKKHQDQTSFLCPVCLRSREEYAKRQRAEAEKKQQEEKEQPRQAEKKVDTDRLKKGEARTLTRLAGTLKVPMLVVCGLFLLGLYAEHSSKSDQSLVQKYVSQAGTERQGQQSAFLPAPPPSAPGEGPYGKEYRDPDTGMEFVWVPPGSFDMGDTFGDGDGDEKPVHRVRLQGFYLGKYAVTQGEWEQIMGENPSRFKKGPRYPVDSVSWKDVEGFIGKLNRKSGKRYALPSEAQWEYAAGWRADGMKSRFGTGKDSIGADEANFNASKEYKKSYSRVGEYRGETVAVDSFSPNGLGLYQMSGNVWEWVQDCRHDTYQGAPTDGSAWEGACSASFHVVRGCCWSDYPWFVRSALRSGFSPGDANNSLGFRLAFPVHQQ